MMKNRWINVGLSTLLVLCMGATSVVLAEGFEDQPEILGWE